MSDVIQGLPTPTAPSSEPKPGITADDIKSIVNEALQANNEQWANKFDGFKNDVMAQSRGAKRGPGRPPKDDPPTTEAVQLMRDFEQKQAERSISQSLHTNLEALGAIDPAKVSKYFTSNYGDRIKCDEDGTPIFEESNGKVTALKDYLSSWAQSSEGQMFVAARRGPSGIQAGRSTAPISSASPYRQMTFAQIMERQRVDPQGVRSYIEAYGNEFTNKKREYERSFVR